MKKLNVRNANITNLAKNILIFEIPYFVLTKSDLDIRECSTQLIVDVKFRLFEIDVFSLYAGGPAKHKQKKILQQSIFKLGVISINNKFRVTHIC
jgi:hypothetical protein